MLGNGGIAEHIRRNMIKCRDNEKWESIPGYNNRFKISNTGKIISERTRNWSFDPRPTLSRNKNERKSFTIKKLVQEKFGCSLKNSGPEKWKKIEWCDQYEISNYGDIRRTIKFEIVVLKTKGVWSVSLNRNTVSFIKLYLNAFPPYA